jgi:uncharacterized protein
VEYTALEKSLIDALAAIPTIDAHEHLPAERDRTAKQVDVFTLFAHYTHGDLAVAGMNDRQYESLFDRRIPLDTRWELFRPFWKQIRWGSYSRAALLAAERFYGFDDINDATYAPLSEAIAKANTPGIYTRVLRDACNIVTALTQCASTDVDRPLLTPVMPMFPDDCRTWRQLTCPARAGDVAVRTLDDYLDVLRDYVSRVKGEGAVGLKMMSNPYENPNREGAITAFESLRSGGVAELPGRNALVDYLTDQAIEIATREDLVVAVHTGYWGDFRTLDPLHMIPILQRHPNTRFDIYHLGYPWVRESLMLGKGFPNVWLNMCWTHIISQEFATSALDEAIDLIPMNKLIAFGGDYGTPVEKAYGHITMAREDVARVLARRIGRKQMTEAQALDLARGWFHDNPAELYRLSISD